MSSAAQRSDWMGVLARAPGEALAGAVASLGQEPAARWLRPPETGLVMLRGRAGGTGAAFNLGEMTVTRATLRLEDGTVGHGWVAGRDAEKARLVALCDALLQGAQAVRVMEMVIRPLQAQMEARRRQQAEKAAETEVAFFTMARGEDA